MKIKIHILCIGIMGIFLFACKNNVKKTDNTKNNDMFLLVGTYTSSEGSKGIYVYRFDTETGIADSACMAEVKNRSYLVLSADEKTVYAVGENGENDSFVHAFAFDKKKPELTLLNSQNTQGASPCYIEMDPNGQTIYSANYGGGSISAFMLKADGRLSALNSLQKFNDTERQKISHVHCVRFSPDRNYLFATDLGLDKVYRYPASKNVFEGQPFFSEKDRKDFNMPSMTGPRHIEFQGNGKYMYILGELSGEVTVFDYNNGDIIPKQTIAADTVEARGSADIHVSPDGRHLYASNRLKNDGIAIFSVNEQNGTLRKTGYQPTAKHPRNFVITPNGKFLLVASRDENKIQLFSVNRESGLLTDTGQDILLEKPVCLKLAQSNSAR